MKIRAAVRELEQRGFEVVATEQGSEEAGPSVWFFCYNNHRTHNFHHYLDGINNIQVWPYCEDRDGTALTLVRINLELQ